MPTKAVTLHGVNMRFCIPNELTHWRIEHLVEVEPLTVAWMLGFSEGDVMFDVGANVGVMSIIAAAVRGAQVISFEPHRENFALLCQNVAENNLSNLIQAWPVAVCDETGFGNLHIMDTGPGSANHAFGEPKNFFLDQQAFPHVQASYSVRLDELVKSGILPKPDHVKIDVDGFEYKVLAGMEACLTEGIVDSLLIEVNSNLQEHWSMVNDLVRLGFKYDVELFEQVVRKEGIHAGTGEIVFRR